MSYKQTLLDLINKDNKTSFTIDQLTFSKPRAVTPGQNDNRNTKVDCFGVESAGYAGKFSFTFERISLVKLFTGRTAVAEVAGTYYTLADVCKSLSDRFKITLYPEDFTAPELGPAVTTLTLTPSPDSYYWLPIPLTVEVEFKPHDIAPTLPHVMLPGFVYPTITANNM